MVNKTIMQGRLVRDPELNITSGGVEVCKFTVAWSKKYKETESQCFLNCVAWRQTGVFVNTYFRKGQEVLIEGELTSRSYTDKDGNNRTAFEVTCDQVHFCGSKSNNNNSNSEHTTNPAPTTEDNTTISEDDDLPF